MVLNYYSIVDEPNEASNIVRAAAIVQQTDEPTAEIQVASL